PLPTRRFSDLDHHARLAKDRLVEDVRRHPQRHLLLRVRRIEGGLDVRVAGADALVERALAALERREVPLAVAELQALAPGQLDLDLAEPPVALRMAGVVAEQVVDPRLVADALDAL